MGCGITLISLALLMPLLWFIFREAIEGQSGNFSGLALVIPLSSILLIVGTIIIARSRDKPDSLGDALRDALGKSGENILLVNDLTNLTILQARFRSITDLDGIERCINLTTLNLNNNLISDISPLSSLTKLTEIRLSNNRIHDISPLVRNSGLGKSTTIWLENNNLDLTEDSENMQNIKTLQDRGVEVVF
jgi:hypothetical protein